MIIPAVFYGRYTEVKARTEKIVSSVLKGKSFADSLRTAGRSTHRSPHQAILICSPTGIFPSCSRTSTSRFSAPPHRGRRRSDAPRRIVCSPSCSTRSGARLFRRYAGRLVRFELYLGHAHRLRPYLDSVNRHSRVLDREGARFIGDGRLGSFWQANSASLCSGGLRRFFRSSCPRFDGSVSALYAGLIG